MENNEKEMEIITTEEDIYESDPENNENKKYDEARVYYVYEHIRLDKMEPFYIGKGKGERAYDLYRNDHHDNISNMCGHAVLIIKDNLTEEEAFELERDTIEDYVFNLGYGIDIEGHNDYNHELPHLTNMTWGGEGTSGMNPFANKTEEEMEIIANKKSNSMKGKTKGKNPYANKTPEEMEIIGRKISEKNKGNNPFANKTEEEMKIISNKKSNSLKGKNKGKHHSEETKQRISESNKGKQAGKNNPMFGKKGKDNPTYGEKNGMWGKPAANRSKVICVTTGEKFDSIKEASGHYNVTQSNISSCCIGVRKSAGKLNGTPLKWKYLKDYDDEFNGILINPIIE